jgi:hypothetical protein
VDEKNPAYSARDGALFDKQGEVLFSCPPGRKGAYTIPPGVLRVGDRAFFCRRSLDDVAMPEGLREIGEEAFTGCVFEGPLRLPGSLERIGRRAFAECAFIASVTVPPGAKIGASAFAECSALGSAVISEGVETIGDFAFSGCVSLFSLALPESPGRVGLSVFRNCVSLEPDGVSGFPLEDISPNAFDGCEKLNRENIFRDGIFLDPGGKFLVACLRGKAGACVIPEGVRGIRNGAFRDCLKLTSVVFPEGLYSIGENAFTNCPNLDTETRRAIRAIMDKEDEALKDFIRVRGENSFLFHADDDTHDIGGYRGNGGRVEIPAAIKGNKVEYIGYKAFANQTVINSVVIPDTVSAIGENAFEGCVNLESIHVDKDNRQFASADGVVYDKGLENLICCPPGRTREFVPPPSLKGISLTAFDTKMKLKSGERGWINDLIFKFYPGCRETGGGNAKITYYVQTGGKWIIPSVIEKRIPGLRCKLKVTEIGENVFAQSRFIPEEIEIPAGILSIKPNSFTGKDSRGIGTLRAINVLPDNPVYSSIDGAVLDKAADTLVCFPGGKGGGYAIPRSVKKLEKGVFLGCEKISSITIRENLGEIPQGTIAGNLNLKEIAVSPDNPNFKSEDGVLFSKDGAALIAFPAGRGGGYQIPKGVKEIRSGAFDGCAGLVSIKFPKSLESIGDRAFAGCDKLEAFNVPSGLKHVGEDAFGDCGRLSKKARKLVRARFGEGPFRPEDMSMFDGE